MAQKAVPRHTLYCQTLTGRSLHVPADGPALLQLFSSFPNFIRSGRLDAPKPWAREEAAA